MDRYRHLAIKVLFLDHLPPPPYISLLPKISLPHACCFPLDTFSIPSLMLDLASSNLSITSGLQICLTPRFNHIVTIPGKVHLVPLPSIFPNTLSLCPQMHFP